ncbi:MAG: hypothetical protein GWP15_00440 [Nitrospirae bacterium]|nr:hypothetical protein [Nitrospirota bacterium]
MGGKYMNVTQNSDNVVNALIDHQLRMCGGFQEETNDVPLEVVMDKDSSFTITPIINDTEA